MSTILGIDIETYSSVPLPKCGVYRYVDAPDFEILLLKRRSAPSARRLPAVRDGNWWISMWTKGYPARMPKSARHFSA